MKFGTDKPVMRASRTLTETGSAHIDELDLYDELATFSALSPEEQRDELERVERSNTPPVLTVDDPPTASFDFIEQSDVPTHPELDGSPEPVFNLIEESQVERIEQRPSWASADPAFAFVEESSQETSLTRGASQIAAALPDVLRSTSPLEVIDSGALATAKCQLKCESCGADSSLEDLFCLSCGELWVRWIESHSLSICNFSSSLITPLRTRRSRSLVNRLLRYMVFTSDRPGRASRSSRLSAVSCSVP